MKNESKKTVSKEEIVEILSVVMRDEFCGNMVSSGNKIVLRLPQGETFRVTVENA